MFSFKVKGIQNATALVDTLKNTLPYKVKQFLEILMQEGYSVADDLFHTAIYAGTNDVQVEFPYWEGDTLYLTASGDSVAFIEFGSGTFYGEQYPTDIAGDGGDPYSTIGMERRGNYGQGKGASDTWGFYGEAGNEGIEVKKKNGKTVVLTHGNPPARAMYMAAMTVSDKSRILAIAKEVFNR